jgi:hypothetical protein
VYLDKYHTPGAIKHARDLGSPQSRAATLELQPFQSVRNLDSHPGHVKAEIRSDSDRHVVIVFYLFVPCSIIEGCSPDPTGRAETASAERSIRFLPRPGLKRNEPVQLTAECAR